MQGAFDIIFDYPNFTIPFLGGTDENSTFYHTQGYGKIRLSCFSQGLFFTVDRGGNESTEKKSELYHTHYHTPTSS